MDSSPAASGGSEGLKAAGIQHLRRSCEAMLPGGRDREGRPLLLFPAVPDGQRRSPEELRQVPNDTTSTRESHFLGTMTQQACGGRFTAEASLAPCQMSHAWA